MKPHVVILSTFLTPFRSGAEACAEEISKELSVDFHITILTARLKISSPRYDILHEDVQVHRIGLGLSCDKWLFPFLAPLVVLQIRPQIIHAVLESFAGLALLHCRFLSRAKRILTCQSTNTNFKENPKHSSLKLIRTMHKHAHKVTVISKALQKRAQEFGREDAVLIPNGLRLKDIPKKEKVFGRILFAGRLEPQKGIDILLQAMVGLPDHAHLHIVGDGSLLNDLKQQASFLTIDDKVTFIGFVPVPDVYEEFAQAEIFCGLSRSEAFGNVFAEAQAAGCCVVGTNVGGIPDIIEDGVNGLLVPSDDVSATTSVLKKLLEGAELRGTLGAAAIQNAKQYDWGTIAQEYAEVYRSILDSQPN